MLYDWSGSSLKISMKFQNNSFLSVFFFFEVILAVRKVIWIDVSTFECSVSWKVSSKLDTKVRVLGSLGFRKLVFKIYYYIPRRLAMMVVVGMGLDLLPFKKGSF